MEKKYSLLLALIITLIIFINFYLIEINLSPLKEKVNISRIIDGDTIELSDGRKIRLSNVNSPEKGDNGYNISVDYLKKFEGEEAEIEIMGIDRYGRNLARIYGPEYINLELIKSGFSLKFLVDKSELEIFNNAERDAIDRERGIWKKSPHFNCLDVDIDFIEEVIEILNKCDLINIGEWVLRDESRKNYKFKERKIGKLTFHTWKGNDNSSDVFWNFEDNVWNNDRDSLYIFDENWRIVYYESYGY
jgi:endonuclease YncB( thermonuclease family)